MVFIPVFPAAFQFSLRYFQSQGILRLRVITKITVNIFNVDMNVLWHALDLGVVGLSGQTLLSSSCLLFFSSNCGGKVSMLTSGTGNCFQE
jgi:hypothetical protein